MSDAWVSNAYHEQALQATATKPDQKSRHLMIASHRHSRWQTVTLLSIGTTMQGCWEALEQVVRMAWAAHCEAQLQAAVDQLRVADSRADDSLSEVSLAA